VLCHLLRHWPQDNSTAIGYDFLKRLHGVFLLEVILVMTEALDNLLRTLPDTHATDVLTFYLHGLHPGDGPVEADTVRAWLQDLQRHLTSLLQVLP
jgi:hypothetical protein